MVPLVAVWLGGLDSATVALVRDLIGEPQVDVQFVVLAPPQEGDAAFSTDGQRAVRVLKAPDETVVRQVLAGADAILLPDERAPFGRRAQIALRYGLIPLARRIDSHAEILVEYDARSGTGGAFLFEDAAECFGGLNRLTHAFRDQEVWATMIQANMQVECGWARPLSRIEAIYRKALTK
jgi:starch synthase